MKKVGKTLLKTFAGDAVRGAIGKFKDSLFSLSKEAIGGSKGAMAALGGLAASFVLIGIAVVMAMKVMKLAFAVAEATHEFQKITGASNQFAESLTNVAEDVRKFGGTVKEVSASFQSLFANVSDFPFSILPTPESGLCRLGGCSSYHHYHHPRNSGTVPN